MSPSIVRKKSKIDNKSNIKEFIKIKKEIQKIKNFVEKNFQFVGENFSKEVREIYYDNKKNRNIYGTVSQKERDELEEEGIELASIPWIENKDN